MNDIKVSRIIHSMLCVFLGTIIYIIFRNDVLFIRIFSNKIIQSPDIGDSLFSKFILYNLSDTLWCFSIAFYVSAFKSKILRIIGLIIPSVIELLQLSKFFPGTFDTIDFTISIIIPLMFLLIWHLKREL